MRRLLIAIVGPYRAPTLVGIQRNIQDAREAAEFCWEKGHYVFCPHLNSAFMDGLVDEERFLEMGLLMIEKVDAVCVVSPWGQSQGSCAEVKRAEALGIPVYAVDEVPIAEDLD